MKFIHTADLHLGVENYGKIDASTGIHSRFLDFKKNLEYCIDVALEKNVDLFLLCGDAYKTSQPTPTQQRLLVTQLLRLQREKIPVVIVIGNHDNPFSFGKSHALDVFDYLPVEGFYVISRPEKLLINTKSGPVQIVGIPWPTRNILLLSEQHRVKSQSEVSSYLSKSLGEIVLSFAQSLDPFVPAILAGHLSVSTGIYSGSERSALVGNDVTLLPSQLSLSQFDYVALGHLHKYQNLNINNIPPIVYSGSLEKIDFGERDDEKGFCLGEIFVEKNKKECIYNFISVPTRKMLQIDIFLKDDSDFTSQILENLKKYSIDGSLVKITYKVPEGKEDNVDLSRIYDACKNVHEVVNIIPVYKPVIRARRIELQNVISTSELIKRYFILRGVAGGKIERLLLKSQELFAVYKNENEEDIFLKNNEL
jgi:exonuclease SbcD